MRRVIILAIVAAFSLLSAQATLAADIYVDSGCFLSQAIVSANNDSSVASCEKGSGADTIHLTNMSSPHTLTSSLPTITGDITILGADKLIRGGSGTAFFTVNSGAKLTLKNITLSNGSRTGSSNDKGGALWIKSGGSARVENSELVANAADIGAGIHVESNATLTLVDTTVRGNTTTNVGPGGAIYVASGGTATISGSAFFSNVATKGGAIASSGTLTAHNSTFYSNEAGSDGGNIYIDGGTATLSHVTVTAGIINTSGKKGKDLAIDGASAKVYLRNSIIGDGNGDTEKDCILLNSATLTQNVGNIIGDGDGACATTNTRSHLDTANATGTPAYIPLPANSDAHGAGDAQYCKSHPTDQRGYYRPPTGCDAGSAEFGAANFIDVNANANNSPDTVCTLDEAVKSANENVLTNAPGCAAGASASDVLDIIRLTRNVSLTSSTASATTRMLVEGNGRTVSVASGSTDVRLFHVGDGGDLTLRNITLSGGNASQGPAVHSREKLTLENCVVKDNTASAEGGAILLWNGGETIINRCAFIDNRSAFYGGAIDMDDNGTLTIANSTFSGNHANSGGGAIQIESGSSATVTLAHLTLWNNTTNSAGAITGIHAGGTTTLTNSIIGRDTSVGGALCGGTFQNSGSARGIIMWNGPTQNNPCGTVTLEDPKLGKLTGFPDYYPLGAGSPARKSGIDAQCAGYLVDQRGAARPATKCDIGAVQYYDRGGSGSAGSERGESTWVDPDESAVPEPPTCTGELLNNTGEYRITVTYGLCSGVQFNKLESSAIGIGYVIAAGPLDAIDVWGWVTHSVEVCFRRHASTLFLDAAASPRTVGHLASTWDGEWTCATITRAGTIVLMPADSYLTTPPVDSAPSAPVSDTTPFADCMVELNYALNFRETPGGTIMMQLPHLIRLTAFQRSGDWVEVDYHGTRGWLSAGYLSFIGSC